MTDLLWGGPGGDLEIRRNGGGKIRLKGRFPYNRIAVLSDGGRAGVPLKELFESGAFRFNVLAEAVEIRLLVGHDFSKPLARKLDGSLVLVDTDEALTFTATLSDDMLEVSYVRDTMALLDSGLATGISPGFRLPPERAVPREKAERITREPDDPARGLHGARIRTILQALLFELSIVTAPAYDEAQVEARDWAPDNRANSTLPDFLRRYPL